MKDISDIGKASPPSSRWRVVLGYAGGMLVEILAVAAISSAALLVMFLVKSIVK